MNKKQYFGSISLLVVLVSGVFYWFEYRTSKIRSSCLIESQNVDGYSLTLKRELKFQECMRRNGLRSEEGVVRFVK
ncbi:hypothetical protein ACFL08_02895 [Patescibacteria group bacterium]